MRPPGSGEELEGRRRRAIALIAAGLSLHQVARLIGCHPSSVMRWRNSWRTGGLGSLRSKRSRGRPSRLTAEMKTQLAGLLSLGATQFGFPSETWTASRVTKLIEKVFGISYNSDHVCRILRSLRYTYVPKYTVSNHRRSGTPNWRWGWLPRAEIDGDGKLSGKR